MKPKRSTNPINRRGALGLIAATASGGAFMAASAFLQSRPAAAANLITGAGVCAIMPETTEGPFYFDPDLERTDITEGRPGVPLRLRVQVVDAGCNPIGGARVDIWHCDAEGIYSGYPRQLGGLDTSGETFLRGTRFADADGIAEFSTIYPGWYPGRTPHIHFKAFPDQEHVLTGQMFFPDDLSREIYDTVAPYSDRDARQMTPTANDGIARRAGDTAHAETARAGERLEAALVIAVAEG
ncbi:MAG: intradiol ring-cleavage dioxygenase [Rhizobiaceae bacterium]